MKNTIIITLWILLLGSSQVFAHSKLASSNPADGQSLEQSPSELLLSFNRSVTLMTVVVEHSGAEQAVATGFKASSDAAQQYQMSLPRLAPGSYQVRWVASGADGHKVKGGFAFVVLPLAASVEGILSVDATSAVVIVAMAAETIDFALAATAAGRWLVSDDSGWDS